MKTDAALSFDTVSDFRIHEVELSLPQGDEILVEMKAVGICHTDLVARAMSPAGTPAVLGHEGAGVVAAVGADVHDVAVGDCVLISFASCGLCDSCAAGSPAYCTRFAEANVSGRRLDGSATLRHGAEVVFGSFFGQSSFARHAVTARRNAVVVAPGSDLVEMASFGCGVQTGAGAMLDILRPDPTSRVIVYGLGGVGMAAVMAASYLGARQIVGVDMSPSRLDTALEVGATHVLDGGDPEIANAVDELTDGGPTHAFDTTGNPAVIRGAARSLRRGGTLVVVGTGPADVSMDVQDLIAGGKTVRGCIEGDADPQVMIPRLVRLHQEGHLPMHHIVHRFDFGDINDAVSSAASGASIKPVLTFSTGQ
ncbi:NAD(P)-dependent alcohol dehydrogenase [Rhodococcus sp. BP-332]|nr:NAD(P)-dependent alcohol dehydrogenase [Rhodococcus sp. BP-332]